MKRTQNESTTETLRGSFNLELPQELQIKPMFEFNVAKNYIMRVWSQTRTVEIKDGGTRQDQYFLIDVRHKNGRPIHERYGRRGDEAKDFVQLRLMAEDYAFDLRPKSRVTKTDLDEDE